MKRITIVGIFFLIIGIVMLLLRFYPDTYFLSGVFKEMYPNLSSEFISIAITILLIDYLYEKKAEENNKKRLIRELASEDKGFTSRALKEIKELGYLNDGTLNNIDLTNSNLNELDFTGASLKNVNFSSSKLNNTIFKNADLEGAKFDNADMRDSNLENTTLNNVSMKNTNFYGSILSRSTIANSDLLSANLEKAELIDIKISDSKLEDVNLRLSNMLRSQIIGCNLTKVNLNSTNMKSAKFERCDFNQVSGWTEVVEKNTATFQACLNLPNN